MCTKFSSLGVDSQVGTHISLAWTEQGITFNGDNRTQHMRSLRNKLLVHDSSNAHKLCLTKLAEQKQNSIGRSIAKSRDHMKEKTERVFRTAYYIAKHNRPFTDQELLVALQKENGTDMGTALQSRLSATNIIEHISASMKKKLCQSLIQNNCKISLMLDESTTISKKSVLVVYIRTSLYNVDGHSTNAFAFPLDLVELQSLTSKSITDCLYQTLSKHGFTESFLSTNLIGICSDGASNMIGRRSGVLSRIHAKYKNTLVWHCMCHRIELAVGDSVDRIQAVNHVRLFMDKLYAHYSQSPSNQRELQEVANTLDVQIKKIGRVLDTRWAASSYRSLYAVWNNFPALYHHFANACTDQTKTSTQRATYSGLKTTLASKSFVYGLAIMLDALEEIADLSVALQRESVKFSEAYNILERCIRALNLQKSGKLGNAYKMLQSGDGDILKGVPLVSSRTSVLNKSEFLQALIDNLNSRLNCYVASNRRGQSEDQEQQKNDLQDFLDELTVLEPANWPDAISTPWAEGELKLASLCTKLGIEYNRALKIAFRDYIEKPNNTPSLISAVKAVINSLPISSADCERGFSSMNIICSKVRNRLLVKNISSLVFISLVGPPIERFNPGSYVNTWLQSHRDACDTRIRGKSKNRKHRYQAVWDLLS